MHFVYGDKDFCFESELDWCRDWISTGIIIGCYYVCISSNAPKTPTIEIGIRKCPGHIKIDKEGSLTNETLQKYDDLKDYEIYNDGWWYIEKNINIDTSKDLLIEELTKLYKLAENSYRQRDTIAQMGISNTL